MDVQVEVDRALRRIALKVDVMGRFALDRVAKLTATEWAEVRAGLRPHPDTVAAMERDLARLEARRRAEAQAEAFGAALRSLHDGMVRFAAAIARGWEGAGR